MSLLAAACARPHPPALVDQVGNPVAVASVARLLPLAPDVTELAFALGAGELVIAAPPHADYPPEAARRPAFDPNNVEQIISLRPDLVLATTAGSDPRVVEQLIRLGRPVCTLDVSSCERLAAACELVGTLLHRCPAAEALAAQTRDRCAATFRRGGLLPQRAALYVVWWDPLIVAAPATFHDELLRLAGLHNLAPAAAGRYPQVDLELLLDPRLEVVVAADEPDVRATFQRLLTQPVGGRLRGGLVQIIWLPADPVSRPGPRLPLAIEALLDQRELHP